MQKDGFEKSELSFKELKGTKVPVVPVPNIESEGFKRIMMDYVECCHLKKELTGHDQRKKAAPSDTQLTKSLGNA